MKKLDCRSLPCPQPVMRCRDMLDTEKPTHCLVLVDNDAAAANVRRFWEQRGFTVECTQPEAALWQVEASWNAASWSADLCGPDDLCNEDADDGALHKTLVLITTPVLGRGDDALGQRLMETFLATLPELGDELWRIVLLNGGVTLAATEGQALSALQDLEKQGVSILVCGTCLAHYGLAEARAVGETSNMLDIVTSLSLADKIVRP